MSYGYWQLGRQDCCYPSDVWIECEPETAEQKRQRKLKGKKWGLGKIINEKYPDLTEEEFLEMLEFVSKAQNAGGKLEDIL